MEWKTNNFLVIKAHVNSIVTIEDSTTTHTDQYVWSKIYKRYFDQQGIIKQLKKHSFVTEKDTIEFDKSWKNGVWNCYQTLSLDLKTEDSIKSKVYKWFGILKQLETSEEQINLFFLHQRHTNIANSNRLLMKCLAQAMSLNSK